MTSPKQNIPVASGVVLGDMTKHVADFVKYALSSENHNPGIYYFAILASACYFESVLEEFSNLWCTSKASQDEGFQGRLMEVIAKDVSRATGLDTWKKWLRTLYGIEFPKVIGEDWKTLDILFQLRNQLAHGRTTKFTHFWNTDNGRFLGMTLDGSSYEAPFKHLIEKGVMNVPEGQVPNADLLLTLNVASYFWLVVERSIASLEKIPELSELRRGATSGRV
ncbi:MAG: hypothetical protein Q8Q50_01735 [Methylobacter sp.]|jgi:hypothetical protein|nr:hypothetical protein [Methylobacter sp.]